MITLFDIQNTDNTFAYKGFYTSNLVWHASVKIVHMFWKFTLEYFEYVLNYYLFENN